MDTVSDTLKKAVTCGFIQIINEGFYLFPTTVTESIKTEIFYDSLRQDIARDYDLDRSKRIRRKLPNTGTTIAGLTFRDGVIIATDIRGTSGSLIRSGRSKKIFRLHDNIYAAGAGIADDIDAVARLLRAQLNYLRITMDTEVPVVCANHIIKKLFYRFKRSMNSMNWIIAGVDRCRASIYSIRFSGASNPGPYVSLGLGEPGAISTLESRWKENLDEKEATRLVIDAVRAAIQTDRGSQRQGYKVVVEIAHRIRYKRVSGK